MEYWECRGASLVGFSQGPELRLLIALQDALKPQALEVVQWLLSHGYQVELMSGDGERASHHVASELGLKPEQVKACLSPEDKLRAIQALQAKGLSVAFVGDGMNDAPVLQQADLGISVSQASDLARAASDMTLVSADIASIPEAMQVSSATLRTIHQNLFWAFFYNAVAVPVAMMGFLHPLVCALAMGMSDLLVVGNALRLNARWRQSRASLKSGASEP
jgi:Cu+-exporting ATPase